MAGQEFEWFVGIDWASAEHEVRLLDARGTDRGRRSVPHTGPALGELGDWLEDVSGRHPERVAVAIELVRGAIVEALLARGFAVFGINPKQLDRFRDRYTVAGAKDDRLDAFVLADTLRTDRARYRALQLDDPKIIGLRGVVEAHEELTQELRRLCNRLRAQLERFYPQVLRLCPAADEPWLWALLVLAPTPAHAARLRGARVDRLLRGYRIRRLERTEVMTALREKALPVAPGTVEASSAQVALLLARLRLAHAQHAHCEQQIDAALEDLAGDDGGRDAARLRPHARPNPWSGAARAGRPAPAGSRCHAQQPDALRPRPNPPSGLTGRESTTVEDGHARPERRSRSRSSVVNPSRRSKPAPTS